MTRTLLTVTLATILSEFFTTWIPFNKLHVTQYELVILERTFSTLMAILAMKIFYPSTFLRIRQKISTKRLVISLAIIAFLTLPSLTKAGLSSEGALWLVKGLIFALFIGIDEEFFSRGFIFGALEEYGVTVAAIVSSLHFGILHLGNALWGGQSLSYTSAQMMSAAAVGYLLVGLMLFSGCIWLPILLHGMMDTPMVFLKPSNYLHIVTGSPNWIVDVLLSVIYCAIGWVLIQSSGVLQPSRLISWFKENLFDGS